ncbi:MAG: PP0621 family protein [Rhodoferax sp.]
MKYLLIVALVGALLWWKWHGAARRPRPGPPPRPAAPQAGVPMLPCRWCQLNVPEPEMVRGRLGLYCCQEHRTRAEP